MHSARFPLFLLLLLPLAALSRSVLDGVYTKEQATRGAAAYGEECAKCHAENLAGGDGSPELAGSEFMGRWKGNTVGALFAYMSKTMPSDDPGHLSSRQYADLTAFILKSNDYPAGAKELEHDAASLNDILIEAKH